MRVGRFFIVLELYRAFLYGFFANVSGRFILCGVGFRFNGVRIDRRFGYLRCGFVFL